MNERLDQAKPVRPLDAERLAATAYHSLVEQLFQVQQRMIMRRMAVEMFGDEALPLMTAYRSGRSALSDAPDAMKREDEFDRERYVELVAAIRDLEPVFKARSEASMAEFVKAMAERMKNGD